MFQPTPQENRTKQLHERITTQMMTRDELSSAPCPMGGAHRLTQPMLWIGASCFKCHQTWEGTGLAPTWF